MIKKSTTAVKNSFLYNMIINFDSSTIKLRAYDNIAFLRGLECYDEGAIFDVYISKIFNDESLEDIIKINAKVGDPVTEPSNVEIKIDTHGDILRCSCSCEDFSNHSFALCKHIIAVLLYLYNNNKIADIKNKALASIADSSYTNLIKYYENKLLDEAKPENINGSISLIPKLLINTQGFLELYFSIGCNNKKYVVKDIFTLAENIKLSETQQYGKSFEINHSINNFDDKSKPLAKLIVNLCYEYLEMYGYNMDLIPSKKSIKLPNSQLDLLMDLLRDEAISLTVNNKTIEVKFIDENPSITFGLEKNYTTNKYDFYIDNFFEKNVYIFKFLDKTYIIYDCYFYKCSKDFVDNVMPAIEKIKNTRNLSIPISHENLSIFYSTVLVRLKEYANVIVPEDIAEAFINVPLQARVYLDTNKSKQIFAQLIFSYGNTDINALDKSPKISDVIIRDLRKENSIISFLKSVGFIEKDKKLVISNENDIYSFVSSSINQLIDMCEVNASESFGKIKLKNPTHISMGIKLANNLIELDLENLDYNINELKDILKQYRVKKKYYRLKDGSFLNLNEEYFDAMDKLASDMDIFNETIDENKIFIPQYRSLNLESLISGNDVISADKNIDFLSIIRNLTDLTENDYKIPESLDGILRSYQKIGFKWLKTLAHYSLGGILADDMGLGKTLQIITLLLSDNKSQENSLSENKFSDNSFSDNALSCNKPSIVICPTSLIFNWLNEVEKFAPELKAVPVVGTKAQRIEILDNLSSPNLIITSYDLFKRDFDIYRKFEFRYCIIDEAQYIKNSYTLNASSVKCIKSEVRFALTGTPIENSLSDLWSIFDFIMPRFLLSYKSFKDKYENPIIKENDTEILNRLHSQIEPFILRRLKKDVLSELPDKMEISSYTKMDSEQKNLYTAELIKANEELSLELENNSYEKSQIKILSMITRLRQICCHPSLFIENYEGDSAKLNLCMHIVKDSIDNGHKILIFSQFTSMLDIIAKKLAENKILFYMLTGSTKSSERIELIDKFNSNSIPIFLISLKAGGTGLNLTGADIVIHFDPWWNNSAQNQATDRVHRIGQKNKVQVFKLITKDTIEEKIEKLQQRKQNLFDSVITEKAILFNTLTKEEIRGLFEL